MREFGFIRHENVGVPVLLPDDEEVVFPCPF